MFFCYLLKSLNEKHINDTYIGFTDDPIKRLRQHNGIIKGGAKRTSKKRPWCLVLVISNFPNKILALKFEWAWINPFLSKFTSGKLNNNTDLLPSNVSKSKQKKKYYETVEFKIKALNALINSKVFEKISLYIHVFDKEVISNSSLEVKFGCNQFVELATDNNFNELIKKRAYFYKDQKQIEAELQANNSNDGYYDENFVIDKCIICDEALFMQKIKEEPEDDDSFMNYNTKIENIDPNDNIEMELSVDSNKDKLKEKNNVEDDSLAKCPYCKSLFHLICLAKNAIDGKLMLIPKEINCLICGCTNYWNDFIK